MDAGFIYTGVQNASQGAINGGLSAASRKHVPPLPLLQATAHLPAVSPVTYLAQAIGHLVLILS